jgi:hypothetical protein
VLRPTASLPLPASCSALSLALSNTPMCVPPHRYLHRMPRRATAKPRRDRPHSSAV